MQQPELGRRIIALRKEKNLTQEELVEKSNVSVRTIQRIEAGEVLPRMITVKILLEALGESYESFSSKQNQVMETQKSSLLTINRNSLLIAVLAGAVYLVSEIILGTLDIAWLKGGSDLGIRMNTAYIGLTVLMVISFVLFNRGFIVLSTLFENQLLKIAAYLQMIATLGIGILDVRSLTVNDMDSIWIPYMVFAVILGTLSIIFGVSLIRLQDGMGELSRIAGIMEIMMGCILLSVVLFFIHPLILIPVTLVKLLVLYRAYEYLSKSEELPVR